MTKIFLDDVRNPVDAYSYTGNPIYLEEGWIVARSFNDFVSEICDNTGWFCMPDVISFDHDLAPEHYVPEELWDDYKKSEEYQDAKRPGYKEKTGDDCAKFVVMLSILMEVKLPECYVHSQNPVGAKNIRESLADYEKTKKNYDSWKEKRKQ